MTYVAKYKCRLCGEIYKHCFTDKSTALSCMMYAVHGIDDKKVMGIKPEMHDIHFCNNDNFGVSDFLGFEVKNENNRNEELH